MTTNNNSNHFNYDDVHTVFNMLRDVPERDVAAAAKGRATYLRRAAQMRKQQPLPKRRSRRWLIALVIVTLALLILV